MGNEAAAPLVVALDDAHATLEQVGGKGVSLARMAAAGLPVPPGFQITTAAYRHFVAHNQIEAPILQAASTVATNRPETFEAASQRIAELFAAATMPDPIPTSIRQAYVELWGGNVAVAVRSSATAEDLPGMSFAGQQESCLNIRGESALLEAVKRCWASLWTARAIGYRAQRGIPPEGVSLAVVVQELVPAEAAGIVFSANPVSGAQDEILINAAWGLGEAIVGGRVTPDMIVVDRASGRIVQQAIGEKTTMTVPTETGTRDEPVSAERRREPVLSEAQTAELAAIAVRIDTLFDQPVDIEWARAGERFFILQARPITGLPASRQAPEVWNDSLLGDYLWTNGNVGEAMPDVMTPCTWSLGQVLIAHAMPITEIDGYRLLGNIGGRVYMNWSLIETIGTAVGVSRKKLAEGTEQAFGRLPHNLEVPLVPLSRWRILRTVLPLALRMRRRVHANLRQFPEFLATAPARCDTLHAKIAATTSAEDLVELWQAEIEPFFLLCCHMLEAGARRDGSTIITVRRDLRALVGEADANALTAGLHAETSQLASLEPLLGLAQLARGEIDRATFARRYGHRGPHELEVSRPRPAEDPDWIDRQLAGLREAPVDVAALLARQREAQATAWERFRQRFPRRAATMRRRLDQLADVFRAREAARSEVVRVFWVLRAFVLRAGAITGQGEELFFLSIDEIVAVLGGVRAPLAKIPTRRAAYQRYSALPPYPALIRGHFDPFTWVANPHWRSDLFDAREEYRSTGGPITGFPGAAGVVEGRARVLASADEGDQLRAGEILVTTVTNVGWTPLFPRAAAVVTDVGAPLSHAAVVARELGIPAVVGCGNATMRIHTGDLLRVDGGRGSVEVLEVSEPS